MIERSHAILTPIERAGAIAMIQVRGDSFDPIGLPRIEPGQIRRANLFGIDDGVVLGVDATTRILMPHGGVAIVRQISDKLTQLGYPRAQSVDPCVIYPEASSKIESWCMHALSIVSSPMGVDVLLQHSARWVDAGCKTIAEAKDQGRACPVLDRLIHPPTIAAVGRANIGKSSLLNTLVGQRVALVADVAGTTRDHVGVPVDLGGLVVRWIDTPGIDERIGDGEEIEIATRVVAHADLIVHCIDALDDAGKMDARLRSVIDPGVEIVRVGMRSDLGDHPSGVETRVCTRSKAEGIGELVTLIRDRLVPGNEVADPTPWRFWASLGVDA